jgi:hypothetical protein
MFDPRSLTASRVFFCAAPYDGGGRQQHQEDAMPDIHRPPPRRWLGLFATLLLASLPALATVAAGDTSSTTPRKPAKVSFVQAPSHETPAAREKRLKRECKGRPNAGMCLGHTR